MRKNQIALPGIVVLGVFLAAATSLPAYQPQSGDPLTEQEFYDLITVEKMPAAEIARLIKERGLAFDITPRVETNLKNAKADPVILETIRTPARLTLQVGVAGVTVSVDGEERGQTGEDGSFLAEGLSYGGHVFRLNSPDHVGKTVDYYLRPAEERTEKVTLFSAIQATPGPYGTQVTLAAGTGADAAFTRARGAADPLEKINHLKEIVAAYKGTPAVLLAYEQLIAIYLDIRDYAEVEAVADSLLALDPRSVSAFLGRVRAALGRNDLAGAVEKSVPLAELLKTAKTMPAPEGVSANDWEMARGLFQNRGRADVQSVQYDLFNTAYKQPAQVRAQTLEKFLEIFPESVYRKNAMTTIAFAYQERGNAAKAVEWAEKTLERDPNEPSMLMVACDGLSNTGKRLGRAEELARRLLALMTDPVETERLHPANQSDEQWENQKRIYEGVAHSAIGEIDRLRGMVQAAIQSFQRAAPLLKSQPFYYARNHYRWALMLAEVGRRPNLEKARLLLGEIIPLNTPYTPVARELLGKINAAFGQ